ncbi:Trypsin-like peptidase domain-containing protein [Nonomuraea maritima]|uniref:Trypsin-like peptidase domain-containing protein n=1 Tax=Nonomuraea maritima TaxID=683260 RepID=A0A1G9PP84_9ACTN|nr:Trypsin-like peptidase domain-containing protein [Nonomuraea maritima]
MSNRSGDTVRRTLVTTLAALAGATLAPPAPAAGRPPVQPGAAPGHSAARPLDADSSPIMRPKRAVRYWTPDRQDAAGPAHLPRAVPQFSPVASARIARPLSVPTAKRLTPGADDNGYARVERPYTGRDQSRVTGRLFFVNSLGQGDSCSASVVRSASGLLVVTAAHCVYSVPPGSAAGRWHTNFAFVPAYDGRADDARRREPYGRWGGRQAWKPDGYTGISGGDWNSVYDLALIEVGRHKRTLQDAVGAFTPMLNRGGRHIITTTGYPGLLGMTPYDGRDQLWCVGRTHQAHSVTLAPIVTAAAQAPQPGRLETDNCHLHKGHSGGPWLVRGTGDLIGVLSAGKDDGEPEGNSVATTLSPESYGALVRQADPDGVYDALSVKMSGPDQPVRPGRSAAVTATVAARGLASSNRVPVTLIAPPGTSLSGVDGARCHLAGRRADCTIGAVHPGTPVRLTARVKAGPGRGGPVEARVTSSFLDPAQRDNTSTVRLPVRR